MRVKIKVLTPVHIGSGQSISPSGYFIDQNGNFNVLNMDSLFRDNGFNPYREEFIRKAATARYIGEIIHDQNLLKKHVIYSIPITPQAQKSHIEVKSFIKSAGRPYFPGSSIKGAMISALIYFALKELSKNEGMRKKIEDLLTNRDGSHWGRMRRSEGKQEFNELLNYAYGYLAKGRESGQYNKFNPGRDSKESGERFLNLFDVSDSNYLVAKNVLRVEICKVEDARSGSQIPVLYETMKENVEAEFDIKEKNCSIDIPQMLEICDEFYRKVLKKDGLNLNVQKQPGHYLLRIGQGATAFSTSLLILAEELSIKNYRVKPPKTRKRLADGLSKGLGFVELILQK